jgi:hypothetical protein
MKLRVIALVALASCGRRERLPTSRDDAFQRLGPACIERPKPSGWLSVYCGTADPLGDVVVDPCANPCEGETLRLRFDDAGNFAGVQDP